MDLFDERADQAPNILHTDGTVNDYGLLLPIPKANHYFKILLASIAWRNDEAIIFGEKIRTKRKVAWYADKPYAYTYSNSTKHALPWTAELLEIKSQVEKRTRDSFNACLLNLYHDGSEGMTWHSDEETELKKNGAIASLSLGAQRKFSFKHKKSKETVSLYLQNGSLIVMRSNTQTHWLHRLPPTKKVSTPRINLTFRTMVDGSDRNDL